MERYEFYHNMLKYRNDRKDVLEHGIGSNILKNMSNKALKKAIGSYNSNGDYGDYYYKIDNFYKDGKAKYFKTKDEYDTWTKNQAQAKGREKEIEREKQHKQIERQHANEVNNKLNYANNKGYAEIAGAERAAKEKENAKREAILSNAKGGREAAIKNSGSLIDKDIQRKKLSEANQSSKEESIKNSESLIDKDIQRKKLSEANQASREAAIKNSNTTVSNLEFAKRVAKDKAYNQREELKKQITGAFKKMKEKSQEKAEKLANAKDMNIKETFNKIAKEVQEYNLASKNPITKSVYVAAKKKEKAVNNYVKENKDNLTAELPTFKKEQINKLNDNSHYIDKFLRKVSSGEEITSKDINAIKNNPLYNSIVSVIKEDNDDFNIYDYLKKSKNVDKFKQAFKTITRETEDRIDKLTIEDLAATRV